MSRNDVRRLECRPVRLHHVVVDNRFKYKRSMCDEPCYEDRVVGLSILIMKRWRVESKINRDYENIDPGLSGFHAISYPRRLRSFAQHLLQLASPTQEKQSVGQTYSSMSFGHFV